MGDTMSFRAVDISSASSIKDFSPGHWSEFGYVLMAAGQL